MVANPDPGLLTTARVTKALHASTNAQQQLKLKPQAQVSRLRPRQSPTQQCLRF